MPGAIPTRQQVGPLQTITVGPFLLDISSGLLGPNGQSGPGPVPGSYCQAYLMGAITVLSQGGPQYQAPSQAALVKYAECMRANGVPDFPDPGDGSPVHRSGTDLDPNNPIHQQAAKICTKKTGVYAPGGGGPPPPGTVVSGPPGQPGVPNLITVGARP